MRAAVAHQKPAQDDLWRNLANGNVTTIGSDHSPSPPDMKRDENFFKVWGGISGVQHTLPLLLTEGRVNRGIALPFLSDLLSANVARRFKIPDKGKIEIGSDADFALVDLKQTFTVCKGGFVLSPSAKPLHRPRVDRAGRSDHPAGKTIYKDGKIVSPPAGRLVKPQP